MELVCNVLITALLISLTLIAVYTVYMLIDGTAEVKAWDHMLKTFDSHKGINLDKDATALKKKYKKELLIGLTILVVAILIMSTMYHLAGLE